MKLLPTYFEERPWARRGVAALCALILFIAMVVIVLRVFATSQVGRDFLEAQIEGATVSGQTIRIDGLAGDLLGELQINQIRVADAEGDWLTIEDLRIGWSPGALVSRHLKLDQLSANRIHVLRQPVLPTPDSSPESETSGSSPLRRYTLTDLDVRELAIEEPVSVTPQNFTIRSSATTDFESGDIEILLTPKDGTGDRVDAELTWSPTQPLSGHLAATGPAGGVLSNLLQVVGRAPVDITLTGDGRSDDWQVAGRIGIDTQDAASVQVFGGQVIGSAEAHLDLTFFEPLSPLADRLGPRLSLIAHRPPTGPFNIELLSDGLQAIATGEVAEGNTLLQADKVIFSIDAREPDSLMGSPDVSVDTLSLAGAATRKGELWTIESTLDAAGLDIFGYRSAQIVAAANIDVEAAARLVPLNVDLTLIDPVAPNGGDIPLVPDDIRFETSAVWDVEAGAAAISDLRLRTGAVTLTASGMAEADASRFALRGTVLTPDGSDAVEMSPLAWQVQRSAEGTIGFDASGAINLQGLAPDFRAWTEGEFVLQVSGTYADNGTLEVARADLSGPNAEMRARGVYGPENADLDALIRLGAGAGPGLSFTAADLSVDVSGPPRALEFAAEMDASDLVLSGETAEIETAIIEGTFDDGTLSAQLDFAAVWRGEQASFATKANLVNETWEASNISANLAGLKIDGTAAGTGGDLDLLTADLRLAGQSALLAGSPDISGHLGLAAETLEIDLQVQDYAVGPGTFEKIQLKGAGTRSRFDGVIDLSGQIPLQAGVDPFALRVPLTGNLVAQTLELSPDGYVGDLPIRTLRPLRLGRSAAGDELDGALSLLGGRVEFAAVQGGGASTATFEANSIDMAVIGGLLGQPDLEGAGRLSIALNGTGPDLTGEGVFALSDLSTSGREAGGLDLVIEGDLDGTHIGLTGRAEHSRGDVDFQMSARLPVNAGAAPVPHPSTRCIRRCRRSGRG
ncbi:MAG: hypothetical protein AAGJ50_05675, partial [Pseudomonadota bacterium]